MTAQVPPGRQRARLHIAPTDGDTVLARAAVDVDRDTRPHRDDDKAPAAPGPRRLPQQAT